MSTTVVEVPRKRHRGRRALIATIVIVVLLVVAFFVADYYAKQYATRYVQQQVAAALDLSSTAPVHVNLGSGSILLQAATGQIDNVTVKVNPLVIDGFAGSATLTASGVPLSSTLPVKEMHVVVDIPQATITKAIETVPSLARYDPKVTISRDRVAVNGSISILGFGQSVGITLKPQVSAGVPSFTILTAQFDGATVSIVQLDKYIPGLSQALQSSTSLCIANVLPKAFVLTGVSLKAESLVSTFTGNGVELNSESLAQKGTCG
jgi:hypothetical protein